jgi:hypothetical protein
MTPNSQSQRTTYSSRITPLYSRRPVLAVVALIELKSALSGCSKTFRNLKIGNPCQKDPFETV